MQGEPLVKRFNGLVADGFQGQNPNGTHSEFPFGRSFLRRPRAAQRPDQRDHKHCSGDQEQGIAQAGYRDKFDAVVGVHEVVATQGFTEMGSGHTKKPLSPLFMPFEWDLCSAQHLLVFFSMRCFPKGKDVVPVVPGVDEVIGPTHAAYEGMHSFRPVGNEKGPGRAQAWFQFLT